MADPKAPIIYDAEIIEEEVTPRKNTSPESFADFARARIANLPLSKQQKQKIEQVAEGADLIATGAKLAMTGLSHIAPLVEHKPRATVLLAQAKLAKKAADR